MTLSNIAGYAIEGEVTWTLISDSTTVAYVGANSKIAVMFAYWYEDGTPDFENSTDQIIYSNTIDGSNYAVGNKVYTLNVNGTEYSYSPGWIYNNLSLYTTITGEITISQSSSGSLGDIVSR